MIMQFIIKVLKAHPWNVTFDDNSILSRNILGTKKYAIKILFVILMDKNRPLIDKIPSVNMNTLKT